jgi:hypothetical protein
MNILSRKYLWLEQWKEIQGYGIERSRKQGIELQDVERLVNECRAEQILNKHDLK